jgi:winged helix DNA-binding protein
VAWLGAVQAQDYPAAKWALGLRAPGLTDADVESAFNRGTILRTHVLRPTWHFVTPADIRWMLALTGPRVNAINGHYCRRLGLDARVLARSRTVLERALRDGMQLTRAELGSVLRRAGVRDADGQALGHVMMNAELEGVVCSGGRQGRQFTYALLEERAAPARTLTRDEALGELTRRYFTSHGPATLRDYVWWSGLTVGDARRGIDIVGQGLDRQALDNLTYWSAGTGAGGRVAKGALLLPNYDEYLIAHQDRDLVVGPSRRSAAGPRGSDVFTHSLILDARLAGSWTRTVGRDAVAVEVVSYRRLTPADRRAVAKAAERYGGFMKQAVVCAQGLAR